MWRKLRDPDLTLLLLVDISDRPNSSAQNLREEGEEEIAEGALHLEDIGEDLLPDPGLAHHPEEDHIRTYPYFLLFFNLHLQELITVFSSQD